MLPISYVLPVRHESPAELDGDLDAYLHQLARMVDEVIVVDGSPAPIFAEHARAWPDGRVTHVPPDPSFRGANGKVSAVSTGVGIARHEAVVVADDDVRYEESTLREVADRLRRADLVWPQNHFVPLPWHARWDTARSLINRAFGIDYPGTVGLRRSAFEAVGGYDGDVLFENLELLRTFRAAGGRIDHALGLYVPRRPPTTVRFWDQRVRQAYDSLSTPARFVVELAVLPAVVRWGIRRRWGRLVAAGALSVGAAELGRRRADGTAVFERDAAVWAPAWALERGVCAWVALLTRFARGGVRYRDTRLRRAATPLRDLRRRRLDVGERMQGSGREAADDVDDRSGAYDRWVQGEAHGPVDGARALHPVPWGDRPRSG